MYLYCRLLVFSAEWLMCFSLLGDDARELLVVLFS